MPFFFCGKLTDITIPESVEELGGGAFDYCKKLENIKVKNPNIKIGSQTFHNTLWMKNQLKKNTLVILNKNLLDGSKAKGNVVIPEGVTRICPVAFEYSTMKQVTLPDTVKFIGGAAFRSCPNLNKIILPEGLTTIDDSAFAHCTSLKDISIPKSVTYLGEYTFYDCFNLESVDNRSSITEIKDYTFYRCLKLSKVSIPSKVKIIGTLAFQQCKMKEITIPDSVIKIEYGAFADCTSLTKVKMSKNIEHVEDRAFRYVPWLEENKETFLIVNGVLIDGSKAKGNITLPKSVRIIAEGAFTYRECDITDITIPDTVKEIGAFAFLDCRKLKKVSLPNSITVIKSGTFMYCKSLKAIKVPSTVTVINYAAFYGCDNLEEAAVTSNLNRIDAKAFGDCPKLDKIRGLGPNVSTYFNAIEPGTTKSKFYINNKIDQLKVGTKYQAAVTNSDTKSKITWSVSDTTIATITSDGVLLGKKAGTVTVTAKSDDLSDSFQVQLFAPKKLDIKGPKELTVGETGEYSVIGLDNETDIEWTISDDPYEVYSPYEILPSITNSSAINFLPHLPGKVTLHAATGDSVGELIITIKDFEIIGPRTIMAGEIADFYVTSNGTDFSWVVYDDNSYNPYFGYGREVSFPTYAQGTYTIEVSHSEYGDKTWELTVDQGATLEEE